LIARIANCLNARSASRTTASPRRGKSLTPTSRSNQGHPSDQGQLTISQKCVTHVFERAKYVRSNSAVANCNLFVVFVSHQKGAPQSPRISSLARRGARSLHHPRKRRPWPESAMRSAALAASARRPPLLRTPFPGLPPIAVIAGNNSAILNLYGQPISAPRRRVAGPPSMRAIASGMVRGRPPTHQVRGMRWGGGAR